MKHTIFSLILVAGGLSVFWLVAADRGEGKPQPAAKGLPGARAVIEAARYPSLQAALDALPEPLEQLSFDETYTFKLHWQESAQAYRVVETLLGNQTVYSAQR